MAVIALTSNRLKQNLNLPPIEPRPPCPPRVYKKVYNYLDTALPAKTRKRAASGPAETPTAPSTPRTPSKGTPSRGKALKQTPVSSAKPRSRALQLQSSVDDGAPDWVMPAVRVLCRAFKAPAAAPHIYAGVCSALKSPMPTPSSNINDDSPAANTRKASRRSAASAQVTLRESIEEAQIAGLIIAIAFYTFTKLSGKETSAPMFERQKKLAIQTLMATDTGSDHTEDDLLRDLETFLRQAQTGWLEQDWYINIPEAAGLSVERASEGEMEDADMDDESDDGTSAIPKGLNSRTKAGAKNGTTGSNIYAVQGGLGTMMQDRVDYLSEARLADYAQWKAKIMARVELIETQQKNHTA